jgi:adenylosuccinate lyase
VWEKGGSFLQNLQNDAEVTNHLDADSLAVLFNMAYHTKHVDTVFKRVFGE